MDKDIEFGATYNPVLGELYHARSGYGAAVEKQNLVKSDYTVDDLLQASDTIKALV